MTPPSGAAAKKPARKTTAAPAAKTSKRVRAAKSTKRVARSADPSGVVKAKRPDALRNRERILHAAYAVFGESGVDAQMTDIAAAAGVGVATLYRNFPTKEDLVNALLDEYFSKAVDVAQEAVQEPNPWEALVRFFRWVTSLQLEDRAVSQFMAGHIGGSPELRTQRATLYEILDDVAHRAKDEGMLRRDVEVSDLRTILVSIALVAGAGFPERLTRRLVGVMIDGLRAPGQERLEGPPLSTEDFEAILRTNFVEEDQSSRAFKRGRRPWPVRAKSGTAG